MLGQDAPADAKDAGKDASKDAKADSKDAAAEGKEGKDDAKEGALKEGANPNSPGAGALLHEGWLKISSIDYMDFSKYPGVP